MAVPFSPITELLIGGTWVDVSGYVRYADGVQITRGRQNEQGDVSPSRLALTLNNRDGRFSNRNPASPYYGQIGRNTPLRQSLAGFTPFLSQSTSTTGVVWAPDSAALDVTGDIDVRADVEPFRWVPNAKQAILSKVLTVGNQRSWFLSIASDGKLQFGWSAAGTSPYEQISSTVPTRFFGRHTVRATLDVDDGAGNHVVTFYAGDSVSAATWTQIGDPIVVAGTTSIFSGSAVLEVGTGNGGGLVFGTDEHLDGNTYRVQVRNGVGGTVVADADFTAQTPGVTSFTDGAGNPWTILGTSAISSTRRRFYGEVSSWPTRWDLSGRDIYVPIEAAGIIRRLTQGAAPLRSAISRNLAQYSSMATGWWTFEDGSDAAAASSAVTGGLSAKVAAVTFGSDDSLPGAGGAVTLNDSTARISGTVKTALPSGATGWALLFYFRLPLLPGVSSRLIQWTTASTAVSWQVQAAASTYTIQATDADGTLLVNTTFGVGADAQPNQWVAINVTTTYAVGTTTWTTNFHGVGNVVFGGGSGSYTGTAGAITSFYINAAPSALVGASFGHVWVGSNALPFTTTPFAMSSNGYVGETARARFLRLCAEEGVTTFINRVDSVDDSAAMGRQRVATFMDLLGECQTVDQGVLSEWRRGLGLEYWPRSALYNQDGPVFSYGAHIAEPFEPLDDDQALRNAVTVSRPSGSAGALTEQLDGPLSIWAPPAGVGRYEDAVEANVAADEQLPDLSAWLVHLGTWDALRYPTVTVKLAASAFLGSPARTAQAAGLDVARRFTVDSLPAWLPPGPADCLVQGYTEQFTSHQWDITFNTSPGDLWDFAVFDSAAARYSPTSATLAAGITTTAVTPLSVDAGGEQWVTGPVSLTVEIGGEQIAVSNISGSGPYTFTVAARSVNGVVKAHTAGDPVTLADPARWAY